jgi:hypothetical protein
MKKPKIATAEKPAPKAKTGQPIATDITEAKPKKPDSAQKTSNKPKAVTPKPIPEAKAGQPVVPVAQGSKPKKASPTQKAPKKAKVVAPKTVSTAEITTPGRANLPPDSIWPNWVEKGANLLQNLLGGFGIKKK